LEIVGPKQDEQIRGNGGLEWLVDGKSYPTPVFDELVIPVADELSYPYLFAAIYSQCASGRPRNVENRFSTNASRHVSH
jgi:hypothetical protein